MLVACHNVKESAGSHQMTKMTKRRNLLGANLTSLHMRVSEQEALTMRIVL